MLALFVLAVVDDPAIAPAEQAAIYSAAGFARRGDQWKSGNCDGAESESYSPGAIDLYRDINGDGRPEAVVIEGGAICYGMTGSHFWLLSKQGDGSWRLVHNATALPEFLPSRGPGGWPDIEMGGPGFCFPIWRWNGRAYALHKSCRQ